MSHHKNLLTETKKEQGDKIQNLKEQWNGNVGTFSFTAMGYDISGTMTVGDSAIELDGKIPFAVSLFKGQLPRLLISVDAYRGGISRNH